MGASEREQQEGSSISRMRAESPEMILNIVPGALCLILCLSLSSSTLKCQQHSQQHHQYLKQQASDDQLALLIRVVQQQQQQQQQQQGHTWPNGGSINVTQLLFSRFYHLFRDAPDSVKQQYLTQDQAPVAAATTGANETRRQQDGFELDAGGPMFLETRRITGGPTGGPDEASREEENNRRHYFRIINRVFSRVELPEVYRSAKGRAGGGHCGQHIGCVEEIPNFPSLLKKSNVSSSFTIYTREAAKTGHKILYEPTMHHQLQDAATSEIELHEKLKSSLQAAASAEAASAGATGVESAVAAAVAAAASSQVSAAASSPSQALNVGPIRLVSLAAAATNPLSPLHHLSHHHHHHRRLAHNPLSRHHHHLGHQANRRNQQQAGAGRSGDKLSPLSASSWQAAAKIVHSQEFPFDLAALEASGFNASLNTRIIVGGYFAKEDEEWIDEVVRQWLLLEPGNIIKVSWADANRGLYHTAAYNSRIVARQLTLFLHYLDQMFSIDLDKFHLVGHSLGAHIAGFVGADYEGRLARITGLDPAGPIFVELNASMRLDPGDAQFVDVLHTNGGTITKGALGLSTPSGHVDYYCNGGSIQPGCYFSSVTRSIMDPVERVACSHRRSYRYFIEVIKLAISEQQQHQLQLGAEQQQQQQQQVDRRSDDLNQTSTATSRSQLPRAFLFEAKNDELVRLTQPEIVLMSSAMLRRELGGDLAPLRRRLEFHLLKPEFPHGKRGLYFFKTRSEAPFFATKQYALVIRTDVVVRRKIALMAKIDQTLVLEAELDEIPGVYMLAFAPNDPRILELGEERRVPQLSLMWKHRSFNLLLSQQNELHLSGLELSLLDSDSEEPAVIRYTSATSQRPSPAGVASSSSSSSSSSAPSSASAASSTTTTPNPSGQELSLARNQWYKFEGKLERP